MIFKSIYGSVESRSNCDLGADFFPANESGETSNLNSKSYVYDVDLRIDNSIETITPYTSVAPGIILGFPTDSDFLKVDSILSNEGDSGAVLTIRPEAALSTMPWVAIDLTIEPNRGRRFLIFQMLIDSVEMVLYPDIFLRSREFERIDPHATPVMSSRSKNLVLTFDIGTDVNVSDLILAIVFKGRDGAVGVNAIRYAWF